MNWYEARAFCEWLSNRLHQKIRLPNEAEWEKAARGRKRYLFPWGNEFDSAKCNCEDTGLGTPCSVGCLSLGQNEDGESFPVDMAGNVWEWTTTAFENAYGDPFSYPYDPGDGRNDTSLGPDCSRVVRGGSYLNKPELMLSSFRGRDKPFMRFERQGFRVVKG